MVLWVDAKTGNKNGMVCHTALKTCSGGLGYVLGGNLSTGARHGVKTVWAFFPAMERNVSADVAILMTWLPVH